MAEIVNQFANGFFESSEGKAVRNSGDWKNVIEALPYEEFEDQKQFGICVQSRVDGPSAKTLAGLIQGKHEVQLVGLGFKGSEDARRKLALLELFYAKTHPVFLLPGQSYFRRSCFIP